MKYQTSDKAQVNEAFEYLTKLVGQAATVEIKKLSPKRSLNQNRYYHLLLGIFGLEFGWSLEEAKIIHKREVSPNIFIYEKNGKKFVRSSADIDSKEMTEAIDQLKRYCAEQGLYLPDADDPEKIIRFENMVERERSWL